MTTPGPTRHGWLIALASVTTTAAGDHDMAASLAAELVRNPPDVYSAIFVLTNLCVSASEVFASLQSDTTASEAWGHGAGAIPAAPGGRNDPLPGSAGVRPHGRHQQPPRRQTRSRRPAPLAIAIRRPGRDPRPLDELVTAVTRLCTAVGNIAPRHRGDLHLWQTLALGHARDIWGEQ